MKVDKNRLFSDIPLTKDQLTENTPVVVDCGGVPLYALFYPPDKTYEGPRPFVCLCHGFPGNTCNDDLAMALRRCGFAVLRVFHRGSWGNAGWYNFTNNISDARRFTEWVLENKDALNVDPDLVFLCGHSVGGQTVINVGKQLDYVKGVVALAPYDCGHFYVDNCVEGLAELANANPLSLKQEYPGAWMDDAGDNADELYFPNAAEGLKDKDMLFVTASYDFVASKEIMCDPLIKALEEKGGKGSVKSVVLEDNHDFTCTRTKLAETVAEWLCEEVAKFE